MFKNIKIYFNKIKSILPNNLKNKLFFLYLALLVSAILEMVSLGSIPVFISFLIDRDSNFNILGMDLGVNIKNFFPRSEIYIILPIIIIFIYLFKSLYLFFVLYIEQKLVKEIKLFFVNNIFQIYMQKPYSFFLERNSAELMRNIVNESQTATSLIANVLQFSRELSILIVITILLLLFEPFITIFSISTLSAIGFLFYKFFNLYLKELGKIRLKFLKQVMSGVNTMIGAIKDIKIYKKENFFLNNFKNSTNLYEKVIFKINLIQRSPRIIFEFVAVLVLFFVFYLFMALNRDALSILPIIGLLTISIVRLIPAFSTMSSSLYFIRYVKQSFDNVSNEIIEFKKNQPNKKQIVRNYSHLENNLVQISNLKFFYKSSKNISSIENVNLSIKKGEMVGIIGKSGAGKSTLINLILGLLSPSNGVINFDKKEFKQENIFSYVPQEIFLLDDTLRKNIAFGDCDKEIRDENVYDAIKLSGLSSFVEKNKKGLELIVGERGIRLSGGEKQRVGIARALYKKPDILILDEATSSLDYVTEKDIISSIDKLKKQITIVIVSHRLSTIENCDKVFLISNGKTKDSGKLDYLRSKYPEDFLRTN
jgi:ATP-binding cassette subfamily C protein